MILKNAVMMVKVRKGREREGPRQSPQMSGLAPQRRKEVRSCCGCVGCMESLHYFMPVGTATLTDDPSADGIAQSGDETMESADQSENRPSQTVEGLFGDAGDLSSS